MNTPPTDDEDAIRAVIEAESAAYFRNDFEGLTDCWLHTPEARWIWSGPQTGTRIDIGWDEISEKFRQAMKQRPSNFEAKQFLDRRNFQMCISGDLAWVYYDQRLKQNHPDFQTHSDQKELKILHRLQDGWKIACISIIAPALMDQDVAQIRMSSTGEVTRKSQEAHRQLPEYEGLILKGKKVQAAKRERDAALQTEIAKKLKEMKAGFPPSYSNRNLRAVPLGQIVIRGHYSVGYMLKVMNWLSLLMPLKV